MGKLIAFATGTIYAWGDDSISTLLDYTKALDVRGIELTIARKDMLMNFSPTISDIAYLKSLDYVSIHSPFWLCRMAENEGEVISQLDKIQEIYNQVNAKNVVLHPTEKPKDGVLESYNIKFSTENLNPKSNISIADLERILSAHPSMGLCLDVSHAYLWGPRTTEKLVRKFKDRITQVHFSGADAVQDHLSLRDVGKDFMKSIRPLKHLDVPIVIEEDLSHKGIDFVKEEVAYVKSLFR